MSAKEIIDKILIVDDQSEQLAMLKMLLTSVKATVITAKTADEALILCQDNTFAVALLDVQLPGINGLELAQMLRKQKKSCRTPIIFMSGVYKTELYILSAFKLGAIDYIFKPPNPEILLGKVNVFLNQARQQRLLDQQTKELTDMLQQQELINQRLQDEITARENAVAQLSKQNQFLQVLIDTIPDPIFYKDLYGTYLGCNKAFVEFTGKSEEEIVGHSVYELMEPRIANWLHQKDVELLKKEGVQFYELDIPSRKGYNRNVTLHKARYYDNDGNVSGFVGLIHDITRLKSMQNELHQANVTKDKLFSVIAHDIKNPLNGIAGLAKLLDFSLEEKKYDELKQYIVMIEEAVQNAADLVDNLSQWARSQTGKLNYNPEVLDVLLLVQESIAPLLSSATQKQIDLQKLLTKRVYVRGDKNMLKTIVRNLVSNAIKFTPQGGNIKVKATVKDAKVLFEVIDTGIGIPVEKQHTLFDIDRTFTRTGTAQESGTGLGLLICQEFLSRHHSLLNISSKPDVGSSFSFELSEVQEKKIQDTEQE